MGPKHPKSREHRQREYDEVAHNLHRVGLPAELTDPLLRELQAFVDTGQGFAKTVPVPGTPLRIQCLVSNQAHIPSVVRITRAGSGSGRHSHNGRGHGGRGGRR